jgi:hypothetical protein
MRIGFIIDESCHQHHVGVRNYCLSLVKILQQSHTITFLTYDVNQARGEAECDSFKESSCPGQWYALSSASVLGDRVRSSGSSGQFAEQVNCGTPQQLLQAFSQQSEVVLKSSEKLSESSASAFHRQALGVTLDESAYDLLVLTAPWLPVQGLMGCKVPVYSLIYDSIPNTQTLTKPHFSVFASLHQTGFEWSIQNAQGVWFISPHSQQEFLRFFPHCSAEKTRVLPPLLPQSYLALQQQSASLVSTWEEKEPALVLAAPFDVRKGLAFIPQLLESVVDELETLYIYGNQRCSKSEMKHFFKTLPVKNIHWVGNASSNTVHQLFAKSRGLLFPSIEEGLGLPIIEAQLMGTKVLTLDKSPMRELQLPQWQTTLGSDATIEWGKVLKDWFQTPYNPEMLKQTAINQFVAPLASSNFLETYFVP